MLVIYNETLDFEFKDIYFSTDLSHWGEAINLRGVGRGGGMMTMQDYIDTYYEDGT